MSGPFFDYSETWQLVINTSTTIVTFGIEKLDEQQLREMSKKLAERAECVEDIADDKAVQEKAPA